MDESQIQAESTADFRKRAKAYFDNRPQGSDDRTPRLSSYVIAGIGIIGLAYCMSALWIGMRDVLEVGGSCASGNSPYVIENPCPEGSEILMAPAIPLGFVFGAMMAYGLMGIARGAASLVILFWPALFISLGWNFLEGAINPPGGGGLDVGWLVCGIVFMLMGIPVLFGVPAMFRGISSRKPVVLGILAGGTVLGILLAMWVADAVS